MKKFLTQSIPFVISLLGITVWYFSFQCIFKDCAFEMVLLKISDTLIRPFGLLFLFSSVGCFLIIFLSKQDYRSILKFVVTWFLASLFLVSITDTYAASFLPVFTKTHVATLLGSLFSLITTAIVARKLFFSKK
jgi:hypothetical protein